MSYDHHEQEHHLTPTGWKSGTSYFYGGAEQEVKPPPDRVLTIVREVKQSSGWSPEDISWYEKWRSSEIIPEVIDGIILQFGNRPPEPDKTILSESLNIFFLKEVTSQFCMGDEDTVAYATIQNGN
jgi:hypothetical protein